MAGIYIHVPFCKSFCNYCTFCRTTDTSLINDYIDALYLEISRCQCNETIETIYIGGGTPSSIGLNALNKILTNISSLFDISHVKEFTVECNPEDMTTQLSEMLLRGNVNRVSMGVQSLNDDVLKAMNRRHNSNKVIEAIDILRNVGITNISVDFIYGLPEHLTYAFEKDLERFVALNVPHLSAYSLSYEEGALFYNQLAKGEIKELDDDLVFQQYNLLTQRLQQAGYSHYEISNYALNGQHSQHNSSYWNRVPYFGFGPAACSYFNEKRISNTYDIRLYIEAQKNQSLYYETEILTNDDTFNEIIMLKLRTKEGVSLSSISQLDKKYTAHFLKNIKTFIDDGSVLQIDDNYRINEKSWFSSNYIISRLFV